jgi:excinuclease UvrABC nuclease subunit
MLYYVYAHYENKEVVYVGVGKGGRCWDTHGSRRNKKHKEWLLSQLPFLDYEILFDSEDKKLCFKYEQSLIKQLNPKFNCNFSKLHKQRYANMSKEEKKMATQQIKKLNTIRKNCEHCQGEFSSGMYSRWHGDNCKAKKG